MVCNVQVQVQVQHRSSNRDYPMADETEVETVTRIHAVDIRDLYPDRAPEDATSRVCLLCGAKLKDKTHNLTRHLERHHAGALLQLLEQRNQASPSVLASRTRRTQQEKTTARQTTAGQVEDSVLKAGDAKLALARWLAQEQLPVDLIEKSGFREFVEALNEQFSPPKREELRRLLGTLVAGTDDSKLGESDMMTDSNAVSSTVEMMALRATCRCNEDSPLVSCSRVACDIVDSGKAKVKVLRAAASLLDGQTCRGKILGKNGVLGRSFVGVIAETQSEVTSVKLLDKVVASPFIFDTVPTKPEQHEQHRLETHTDACLLQPSDSDFSCIGVSASSGALAEYIVVPVSNLSVVPPAVPDDLALLSDDISVVLSIANELQRRQVTNIAILSDGPSAILSNLLTRYLHQNVQFAPQNLHVFSTSTVSTSVWSQHVSLTPLDIYQPAAVAQVMARQTELALDVVVDLIGSEASVEFALSLVQSMGCVVLVDRSRLELHPQSTIPMDMNSVAVRELEVVSIQDCRSFLGDALQYLATQAQTRESATELRECLLDSVKLSWALHELQTIPERTLEARYLQVVLT
ncbi:Alcohol dehydrogenase GroES-like domain [Phytophthora infestans]|uniref:Alcohol dehydrogenase GroES-like domain n=1 Tax=Phytophthora infestans TaxID=4787 RepID=A0A833SS92_PHYIN|nr:Alcohol dehydrogenase GroES-like domain [Phytophthora infestans]